jgi:hypothetical protein
MSLKKIATEAKLLLIGIPVLIWTLFPIYHMVLFAISPRDTATSGHLWPESPTLQNFEIVFKRDHFYLDHFWQQLVCDCSVRWRIDLVRRDNRRFCHQSAESTRWTHGDELGFVYLFHSSRIFGRTDVQNHGLVWFAQQPMVFDLGNGDHRFTVLHLGAQTSQRQTAV